MGLQNQILSEIKNKKLEKNRFLLAVSGGVDSMVLLSIFHQLKLPFEVAHVNYGFRQEASNEEERMVADICSKWGNKCHIHKLNGYDSLKESNITNLQNFAREERYKFFHNLLISRNLDLIVTAHHQNDVIETVLYKFFKGTGWKGMKGMDLLNNKIFRPLLNISKDSILTFAELHGIKYLDDLSNFTSDYDRNFIRNEVLPLLASRFPTIHHNLANSINNIQEGKIILDKIVKNRLKNICKEEIEGQYSIHINKLQRDPLKESLMLEILEKFQFTNSHLAHFNRLLSSRQGAYMSNHLFDFIKDGDYIKVNVKNDANQFTWILNSIDDCRDLKINSLDKVYSIEVEEISSNIENINSFISFEKLEWPIIIRPYQSGDYFYPLGLNKKKKISKFLIDLKVPVSERSKVLVIQSGHKIAAVLGARIDHRFKYIAGKSDKVIYIKEST